MACVTSHRYIETKQHNIKVSDVLTFIKYLYHALVRKLIIIKVNDQLNSKNFKLIVERCVPSATPTMKIGEDIVHVHML